MTSTKWLFRMPKDFHDIKILTLSEVADILRVHRSTVSRYAKKGELKSYIIGNRRLFKDTDVMAFFDNLVDEGCVLSEEV